MAENLSRVAYPWRVRDLESYVILNIQESTYFAFRILHFLSIYFFSQLSQRMLVISLQ